MRSTALASVIFLLCLAACGSGDTPAQQLERKAKEAVARSMKDPDSTKFRDVKIYPRSGIVCGEVNSKNSYGAMAGFQKFVYKGGAVTVEEDDPLVFAVAQSDCFGAMIDEDVAGKAGAQP